PATGRGTARVAGLLGVAALVLASPAAALDELSPEPLERAAVLALPSVYRVETRVEVPALRTRSGELYRLPAGGRTITELGTAFAVSPDGVLVTAAHVAAPTGRTLALSAAPVALAARGKVHSERFLGQWVRQQDVRPAGARVVSIRVWPAVPDGRSRSARPLQARVMAGGIDRDDDLALLRIPARGIPALTLDDATTVETPIVTVGFGSSDPFGDTAESAPVPTVRRGELGPRVVVESLPEPLLTFITAPVENGDSGGPAVDAEGRVRGVVRLEHTVRETGQRGGIIEQASRVRLLMDRLDVTNRPGPAAAAFRRGMEHLWGLEAARAEEDFARTLDAAPSHALAARARVRAEELQAARFRLAGAGWTRGLLLGAALVSALASAACLGLLAGAPRRPGAPVGAGAPLRRRRVPRD
ncbi:MAG TPA: serine protease, partial [Miltoncostaeaceae bacterium]|nr:serine protease [Miltoncostaeaceae bacterium]